MSFYVFAWIASILFSLEVILAKLTAKHAISNPWLFNFVWTIFFTIFTIPPAVFFGASMPQFWDNLIIASVFYTITNIFFILALYKLDVSVISPMYNLRTALAVFLGAIFLGEFLSVNQYMLVFIMFIAGILTTVDEKLSIRSFFNKNIALVLIAIITLVFMSIFLNRSIAQNGYWTVVLWTTVLLQLFLFGTFPLFKKDIGKIKTKQIGALAIMALVGVVAILASFKAYEMNVGITSAILSIPLSMIIAFGFSVFAPKLLEKHTLRVYAIRFGAVAVMILAGLKLSG